MDISLILRQHYCHYTGRFLEENIYFHILGRVTTIHLMILKYKVLVCKKAIISMMFSFIKLTKEIHSVHTGLSISFEVDIPIGKVGGGLLFER